MDVAVGMSLLTEARRSRWERVPSPSINGSAASERPTAARPPRRRCLWLMGDDLDDCSRAARPPPPRRLLLLLFRNLLLLLLLRLLLTFRSSPRRAPRPDQHHSSNGQTLQFVRYDIIIIFILFKFRKIDFTLDALTRAVAPVCISL